MGCGLESGISVGSSCFSIHAYEPSSSIKCGLPRSLLFYGGVWLVIELFKSPVVIIRVAALTSCFFCLLG